MALPSTKYEGEMLDRYLKGLPLNAELDALQRGEEFVTELTSEAPIGRQVDTPLTDDDREHLRRLKFEPGWAVLLRLIDKQIKTQEDGAKLLSMGDPLGNRDQVSQLWAYVAMLKRARDTMVASLEEEVRRLAER